MVLTRSRCAIGTALAMTIASFGITSATLLNAFTSFSQLLLKSN